MPSTVYKGDLAEVAFSTEAGMKLEVGAIDGVTIAHAKSGEISTFTFGGAAGTTLSPLSRTTAPTPKYPRNILVGSQLVCTPGGSSQFDTADIAENGKIFTITGNNEHAGTGLTITVTPALTTGSVTLATGDAIEILPFRTPPMEVLNYVYSNDSTTAAEAVGTDQFLGLTSALTLPETKVDLKRFHVVGLGRDVSVQAPGKFITEGGSFEVAMHSARWLKYCLGQELIGTMIPPTDPTSSTLLHAATNVGDSYLDLNKAVNFDATGSPSPLTVGDYVYILDTTEVDIVSDHEPDAGTWDGDDFTGYFDKAQAHEMRRIVALEALAVGSRVWLNQPLDHPHAASTTLNFYRYQATNLADYGNPLLDETTKNITRPVYHLLYSKATLPSFSLEVSQRRRDIDSDEGTADGGSGDSKELTRVFRGCKVSDFTLTTDNDAALRLSVNFNSALCYTDTGRLEASNPGSRYSAHRMFDDTADSKVKRYISGIGNGTQKPFMFYNGNIDVAGVNVAQVLNFTLTGQTGMQSFYAINGTPTTDAETDQVPFGGSRNVHSMIEGQTTYEMSMEIIVDDPLFYHKMRTATEFTPAGGNQIVLAFEKNGSGATREKLTILIDDYYIVEAPMEIPEDKGPVKSTLKIMPKAIKVISRDTILQY